MCKEIAHPFLCHGDEENGHRACTNGHLTTADQSEIRKTYLASVMATRKMDLMENSGTSGPVGRDIRPGIKNMEEEYNEVSGTGELSYNFSAIRSRSS